MQVFLPYPDYYASLVSLDKKRAWKQVVEAGQIINTLTGVSHGWKNHPAVLMFKGYVNSLILYHNIGLYLALYKHHIKIKKTKWREYQDGNIVHPSWLGDERIHSSHRSNLLRKDPIFYGQYNWLEPNDIPYFWPGVNYAAQKSRN